MAAELDHAPPLRATPKTAKISSMHERVAYKKRHKYLGLHDEDRIIWERFIEKYPDAYDAVIYNQHCGSGTKIPEGMQENIARDGKLLTQWKVDVVAFKGNSIDIVELKPNAGLSALGQVIGYAYLYVRDCAPGTKPTPMLVTNFERPDMREIAGKHGVKYFVV